MLNLDIPYKWKATLALVGVLVAALTGAFADDVLDWSDMTVFGAQVIEAIVAYVAVFKVKNRGQVTVKTVDSQ